MNSKMAEPILVKLPGIVEGGRENDLAKEFFEKIEKKVEIFDIPV